MKKNTPSPGVSRDTRISVEGLDRLEKQLARGTKISVSVLTQWVKCYGEPAKDIIKRYDQYNTELDSLRSSDSE